MWRRGEDHLLRNTDWGSVILCHGKGEEKEFSLTIDLFRNDQIAKGLTSETWVSPGKVKMPL
jgi:hypothetical protein